MEEAEKRAALCSEIAKLVKETREERGISMTELAQKAGLSRAMISFIEHELRNPTLDTLLRISSALDVEFEDLLRKAKLRLRKM